MKGFIEHKTELRTKNSFRSNEFVDKISRIINHENRRRLNVFNFTITLLNNFIHKKITIQMYNEQNIKLWQIKITNTFFLT